MLLKLIGHRGNSGPEKQEKASCEGDQMGFLEVINENSYDDNTLVELKNDTITRANKILPRR